MLHFYVLQVSSNYYRHNNKLLSLWNRLHCWMGFTTTTV